MIKQILSVDIVKVFTLNSIAILVRMLTGMISVKVVAVIVGPSGIALLGQLNNFNTILLGMANGGINTGVTKYVAEFKEDNELIRKFISNAFKITIYCSLVVSFLLIAGCRLLSELILMTVDYYYVFIIFGFTVILFTLNGLLISILNGYKQFKRYVIVGICCTIFGLLYSITMVFFLGLAGAMINAVTYQSVVFFVSLWFCRKMPWFKIEYIKEQIEKPIVKKYFGYSMMTLTSLIVLPLSQIILRSYVISELSITDAGIWEGMNRLSSMYLSVVTTALTIYYLPRLSEISNIRELHKEVLTCYKFIVPIVLFMCITIYIFRRLILWILFTPEFYTMEDLFLWQLTGDFFKVCSFLLAYIMVAKAKTKMYIFTEIIFTSSYVALSYVFFNCNGLVGLTQGYLCNFILYTLAMAFFFGKILTVK